MYYTHQPVGVDTFSAENIRNCEQYVLSVQRELDKVVANNDKKGIRETFDLLAKRSNAVKVLATWRITQRNQGKITAGVDGVALPKKDRQRQNQFRLTLLESIEIGKCPDPIRRVNIPKTFGGKRPLGIPTLSDRIIQDILRTALEPIVEYHFSDNSYGFRPKRSCQDAQAHLYNKLAKTNQPQFILEGDIKGCFDNINHEHIVNQLIEWQVPEWAIRTITKILKSDIFHNGEVYDSERGTPQGGVISPLLANVALTAFDNYCVRYGRYSNPIVRYADDFVIVCKSEKQAKSIKSEIADFLHTKIGLTLSEEKTKITHIKKGFDFLGFNFRKYRKGGRRRKPTLLNPKPENDISEYKLLIKPQKEKLLAFLRECRKALKENKTAKQSTIIHILNPKLIGWGMYYRHVVSKDTFNKIDHEMWWKLLCWSKRRHNNKSMKWIISKYFSGTYNKQQKVFKDVDTNSDIFLLSYIPIKRFVMVKTGMRVYNKDPNTIEYWNKREYTNAYNQILSVKMRRLYNKQKGNCPYCDGQLHFQESVENELHVHHLNPRSFKGSESYSNLRLLHDECHRELHATIPRKVMYELSDKDIDYITNKV